MRDVITILAVCLMTTPGRALEWQYVASLDPGGVRQMVADPMHARLLLGTSRGYRIYLPGSSTWIDRQTADDLSNYRVNCFLADDTDPLALLTGRGDASWTGYIMDNAGLVAIGPIIMYGGDPPPGESDRGEVMGLGQLPGDSGAILACTVLMSCGTILRSQDSGETWASVHFFCAGAGSSGLDLEISANGDVLVAYGGLEPSPNGIVRSLDGGDTWEEISGDMPCPGLIGEVAVDPEHPQHIFARQGDRWAAADPALGVWETWNGGQHWDQILQGNIRDLSMHPYDADILAAVHEGSVVLTRDGGDSWEDITGNLPTVAGGEQCAICSTDNRIYVGDFAHGLWATDLLPTHAGEAPEEGFGLRVCPNPFQPETVLSFVLQQPGLVSLHIVDVNGRIVQRILADESRPAGEQRVAWEGRDEQGMRLPSGIYFAELQADDKHVSRKLLLLK
jgi:photosystem II stability/assembly factor-like uncharacterized protein